MLACIPTKGDQGLAAEVHEHFGSAPYFTLFNTDTGEVKVLGNNNAHHAHGTCHPMNQLGHHKIDCLVCSGIGRRAIEALSVEGIQVLQCPTGTVQMVADKLKSNELQPIDPAKACRGHGQHQHAGTGSPFGHQCGGHGHGHGGGHGKGGCNN